MTASFGSLHYVVEGDAELGLVLIPPNPVDHGYWLYQSSRFSQWFTTVTVDLPGYGRSPRLHEATSMGELAEAVWAAAADAGLTEAVLCGASIGSSIALHMAAQRPAQCAAMVLTGCSYRPEKAFAAARIEGYRQHGLDYRKRHLSDAYSKRFSTSELGRYLFSAALEQDARTDVDSIIRLFQAHGQPDPDAIFTAHAPTLIVTGSCDYAHDGALMLAGRITGSELYVIEGAGHACSQEAPWEWDQAVLDFLARRIGVSLPGRRQTAVLDGRKLDS